MHKTEAIFELSCPYDNEYQGPYERHLYVCSAGLLRSATAATIAATLGVNARSCGSHYEYALVPISVNLVHWAQKIIFVNPDNLDRSNKNFFGDLETLRLIEKKAIVWNIEDDYDYMSTVLLNILTRKIKEILT
jgi:predicted protein tyrosine phosphatase